MPITYASLFDGIGAVHCAWQPLGWKCVWVSEVEPFPKAVVQHHWGFRDYGDITVLRGILTAVDRRLRKGKVVPPGVFEDFKRLVDVDLMVGGSPCVAFSVAGLKRSLDDARGNLTLEFVRLWRTVVAVRQRVFGKPPGYFVWENVPGVLSTQDNAFGNLLAALVGEEQPLVPPGGAGAKWTDAGCVYGPEGAAVWRILDSQHFGLAQRRRRVFLVFSPGEGADPAPILLESNRVPGDSEEGREAGQAVAAPLTAGPPSGSGYRNDADTTENLVVAFGGNNTSGPVDVSTACNAKGGSGRMDFDTETFVTGPLCSHQPEHGHAMTSQQTAESGQIIPVDYTNLIEGKDVSGTIEAAQSKGNRGHGVLAPFPSSETANPLRTGVGSARIGDTRGQDTVVVHPQASETFQNTGQGWWNEGEVAQTLRTPTGGDSTKANLVVQSVAEYNSDYPEDLIELAVAAEGRPCPPPEQGADLAHTLTQRYDSSPDGTGRGLPLVPAAIRTAQTSANGIGVADDVAHTHDQANGQAVAFAQNSRDEVRLVGGDEQTVGALAAQPGMKQQTFIAHEEADAPIGVNGRQDPVNIEDGVPPLDANSPQHAVAFQTRIRRCGRGQPSEVAPALGGDASAHARKEVQGLMAIRRLTPT